MGWCNYLDKYPMGWREDYRAKLAMLPHVEKLPENLFPSLTHMEQSKKEGIGFKGSMWESMFEAELGNDFHESELDST